MLTSTTLGSHNGIVSVYGIECTADQSGDTYTHVRREIPDKLCATLCTSTRYYCVYQTQPLCLTASLSLSHTVV